MSKKAQQEIAGFVLIVIIVVIALVVYMIIKASSPVEIIKSVTADNMIESIMEVTTSCQIGSKYSSIKSLLVECENNRRCSNGDSACDVLNNTLKKIFDNMLDIETINAYELNYTSYVSNTSYDNIFIIRNGSCLGSVYGSVPYDIIIRGDMGVRIDLKICINEK